MVDAQYEEICEKMPEVVEEIRYIARALNESISDQGRSYYVGELDGIITAMAIFKQMDVETGSALVARIRNEVEA